MYQHFASGHINLVFQSQRYRLRREGIIQLAVVGHDALDARLLARRQCHHLVAFADDTRSYLATETTEVEVGAKYVLDGEAEVVEIVVVVDVDGFQKVEQRRAFIPRRTLRLGHHIVAVECRQGDASHIGDAQRSDKLLVNGYNLVETLLGEIYQVHLVHGQNDVLNAQQRHQEGVSTRLGDDTRTCIHEDNGQVGRRAARNHVARILLVPRRVGNDELAVVGREVAVGYVDGDTLFTFGFQSVQQKGVVDVVAGVTHTLAVALQGVQLVFVQFLAIEQQASYQGGLTVVHRPCRQKAKQVFLFILVQKGLYIQFIVVHCLQNP